MYHRRFSQIRLLALLKQFPIVAVLGPRQIGKSSLVKHALEKFDYLDLENPSDLNRLQNDPEFVLDQSKNLIIDEAQRMVDLFPFLRSYSDRKPKNKIVLLGSANPSLIKSVSESLTGRIGFLEQSGILFDEFNGKKIDPLWMNGQFPRVHWSTPKAKPAEWFASYLKTYFEQDIPQLGFQISHLKLRNLMTMIAHGQGSVQNLSELGGSLGINYHSVSHIIDIFEGTYLLRRLPPFFSNLSKRLVKSPKLYIRDTGILHFLLETGFEKKKLLAHPKIGASFETFCIEQIIGRLSLIDPNLGAFFYRTQAGAEIDLILKFKGKTIPVEIKFSKNPKLTPSINHFMDELKLKTMGYCVCLVDKPIRYSKNITLLPLEDLLRLF